MEILLLGLDAGVRSSLRKHVETQGASKVRFYSHSLDGDAFPSPGSWDVIFLGSKVKSRPEVADSLKKNAVAGLKIVLTEKDHLRSAIEFWGTDVYSYLLKPLNRELFQLVWQNALERVELSKKVSRLAKQRQKQRAGAHEQQEVLKDLFTSHLKMQEINQEKTNFLARTSHELLTPLTALQGYLELLTNGRAGEVTQLQEKILRSSLESCRRLLRLANSLTDLAALERNESYLQLQNGEIHECLSRSIAELRGAMDEKGLELRTEIDSVPPFRFDFDRMQQVFVNLLGNAIKFTPSGGSIRVRCKPHFWERRTVREMLHSWPERRGGGVAPTGMNSARIVIEDNGPGIQPEFLQDIFEEYSRINNGAGTPRGFGLGLAVARRVVLAHEGKIWAESKPEQGSVFTVLVPNSL